MILKGNVWRFSDNISTDHIIPGRFLHLRSNLDELKKHVFEDISPEFYKKVNKGDIIVGGSNFGLGSSREHAPLIIKMVGIDAIIAPSFARIFYRNAINVGLFAIICNVDRIMEGDVIEVDIDHGRLYDQTRDLEKRFSPLPTIMMDILREGGLVPYVKKYGALKI